MQIQDAQQSKRRRRSRSEPSLWADQAADDVFSLLENALREDEPAVCDDEHKDQICLLLEENARLRKLLAQLSNLDR